jgi:hypothetical protein
MEKFHNASDRYNSTVDRISTDKTDMTKKGINLIRKFATKFLADTIEKRIRKNLKKGIYYMKDYSDFD